MEMSIVERTEAKMAELRLQLSALPEGKEYKRQRTAISKELYALENDGNYVAAAAEERNQRRAAAEAVEADAWAATMQREREDAAAKVAAKAAAAKTSSGSAEERLHFRSLVASLFDEYAPTFEAELVDGLRYQTPAKIEAALVRCLPSCLLYTSPSPRD